MDSAGMGAIISFYVSCKRNGAQAHSMRIELPRDRVLTNVDKNITIADDPDQAEVMLSAGQRSLLIDPAAVAREVRSR
jgi:hypothetical protein